MVEEGGAGRPGEELDTKKRLRPGKQNEKELTARESIKEGSLGFTTERREEGLD